MWCETLQQRNVRNCLSICVYNVFLTFSFARLFVINATAMRYVNNNKIYASSLSSRGSADHVLRFGVLRVYTCGVSVGWGGEDEVSRARVLEPLPTNSGELGRHARRTRPGTIILRPMQCHFTMLLADGSSRYSEVYECG